LNRRRLLRLIRFYPPFLFAGIRVTHVSEDYRSAEVQMKLHWWNANFVGTHFGGSLYSMTDPFYMIMLMQNLGSDYIVWDKAATIRFRRPGRGTVRAHFRLAEEQIEDIRRQLVTQEKVEPVFTVQVHDESGEVVAEVEKLLYVRRKERGTSGTPGAGVPV
jgi:acyl-coenzyme A thioesterase PaaI-like protein